ncbi:MAG: hypothetical protein ABUJ92_00760 [Desulfobacterales bacterium]
MFIVDHEGELERDAGNLTDTDVATLGRILSMRLSDVPFDTLCEIKRELAHLNMSTGEWKY